MILLRPVTVLLRFIYLGNKYSETVVYLAEWRSHEDVTFVLVPSAPAPTPPVEKSFQIWSWSLRSPCYSDSCFLIGSAQVC